LSRSEAEDPIHRTQLSEICIVLIMPIAAASVVAAICVIVYLSLSQGALARRPRARASLYNGALSPSAVVLSLAVVGLDRLTDPAAFLAALRTRADALGVASEVMPVPTGRGYGHALRGVFEEARGVYIITVDPDFSGPLTVIDDLWAQRDAADVIVASRYVA